MHILVIGDISSQALANFQVLTNGEYDEVQSIAVKDLDDIRRELQELAYGAIWIPPYLPLKLLWPLADSLVAKWYDDVDGLLIAGLRDDPAGLIHSIIERNTLGEDDLDHRIWRVKARDEVVLVADKYNCIQRIDASEVESLLLIGEVEIDQALAQWRLEYPRQESEPHIVRAAADDAAVRAVLDEHEELALRPVMVFVTPRVQYLTIWDDVKDTLFLPKYWLFSADGSCSELDLQGE